jgi:uncharacterized protein (TIGR03437 family)
MSSANEVSLTTPVTARGMGTIYAHVVKNASGQILSGSVDFIVDYSFPTATRGQGLHIHSGGAGLNGPVTIDTGLSANTTVPVDLTGNITRQAQVLATNTAGLDTLKGMWDDPGKFYANLHTPENPGGAIRGQLMRAETVVLMGMMLPDNEVPPNTGLNASAVGTVVGIVTRDANGVINSGEVTFDVNYNFPSQVTFSGLHVHTGPAGVAAGVTLNSGMRTLLSSDTGRGNVRLRNEMDITNAATNLALENLFSNPQAGYINIHTTPEYPGGAVRAQLRKTDTMVFPVAMSSANELPSVATNATAIAELRAHTLRAANGTVQAGHVLFDVNYTLPADSTVTGLHIHDGDNATIGPVRLNSGLSGANTINTPTGFGNIYLRATISDADGLNTLNSVVSTPEKQYMNLHTTTNPGGIMRSQLLPPRSADPAVGAVISAASESAGAAPGGLISIYGGNMARVPTDLSGWLATTLPASLNGIDVTIGGKSAALLFVSDGQINAQVPADVSAGGQPLIVRSSGTASSAFNLNVAATAPGIFTYPGGAIAVKNSDFSLIGANNPATAGDIIVIYCTGLGQTTPQVPTGALASATQLSSTGPVAVTIGGQAATVIYSIASPGYAGLYQVAARVPTGLAAGTAPAILRLGASQSNTAGIAVR